MLCQQVVDAEPPSSYDTMGISYQALRDTLSDALACLPMIDKGNKMVDKCAKFAATLNHCLVLLGMLFPPPPFFFVLPILSHISYSKKKMI